MKTLHIYSGDGTCTIDPRPGDHYGYVIGTGGFSEGRLTLVNDDRRLQTLATDNAAAYCDYVFATNRIFVDSGFFYRSDLSLYFLTDFSCKRTELFRTFQDYCNVLLLRELVRELQIRKIECHSLRSALVASLRSAIPFVQIDEVATIEPRLLRTFLKQLLSSFVFFFNALLCVVGMRLGLAAPAIRRGENANRDVGDLFLTRFPLHLNRNLEEDKFGAQIVGQHLLVHLLTDGYHQRLNPLQFFRHLGTLNRYERVDVLDRYLSIGDVLIGLWHAIALSLKFNKLRKAEYRVGEVSLKIHAIEELSFSFSRLPRLLMWVNPIRKYAELNRIARFHYYLHEYSYGRMFTYAIKRHSPETKLLAYQHGPAAKIKLVCRAAKRELSDYADGVSSFYVPDIVNVEDEYSGAIYRESGYPRVEVMTCVHRLSYLERVDLRSSPREIVLIAPGLHDGEFLLRHIFQEILFHGNQKHVLKPHPRADNAYVANYRAENLEVSNRPIYELLAKARKVYVTYSSVGMEAVILGLDVEIVQAPGMLCESPLLDEEFMRTAATIRYKTGLPEALGTEGAMPR